MRFCSKLKSVTLALSIASLTAANTACAFGKKRPHADRYTNCVLVFDEAKNEVFSICNTSGDAKDNFEVHGKALDSYFAMPPKDAEALLQELVICRGRTGD